MALPTTYNNDYLALGEQVVIGTCALGNTFGDVESASVKRTADKEEIESCSGGLRAILLKKLRFELKLDTTFSNLVTPPGIGDEITLPLVGVVGRILDVEVKWTAGKARSLSIMATSWDSLAGATLYRVNAAGVFTSVD